MKRLNLEGQRFGMLTAIEYAGKSKWICKCDCGNQKKIEVPALRSGATKSCGCLRKKTATKQALINAKNNYKGEKISNLGYKLIRLPDHPGADANGYVFEHRLIVEKNIGRYLRDDEVVHHKNLNRLDNRIENLAVMTRAEHTRMHRKMRTREAEER